MIDLNVDPLEVAGSQNGLGDGTSAFSFLA